MSKQKVVGLLAEFPHPGALLKAAEKMREAGFQDYDCHSPFPIHGMDQAMGEKRSPLGWMVGILAFIGFTAGMTLEWWTSAVDYPLVISGKPFFSYPAYGPVAFAFMVIFGAFTAVLGMSVLNKLPRFHHPVFYSDRFAKASDDGFFVSVENTDPQFDTEKTRVFLEEIGGQHVELLLETDEEQALENE
ncbi:MAG: DUF3341 domain-containing protein [Caldithrix sp.]|nr:DUF3341 domain-containing protein [Caldithrix sp.]